MGHNLPPLVEIGLTVLQKSRTCILQNSPGDDTHFLTDFFADLFYFGMIF